MAEEKAIDKAQEPKPKVVKHDDELSDTDFEKVAGGVLCGTVCNNATTMADK